MTYISGAPSKSDGRAYMAGNLENVTSHVDAERERQRLKLLRELYDAQQKQRRQQPQSQLRPPVFTLPRGPVYWHATPALVSTSTSISIAGPAPVVHTIREEVASSHRPSLSVLTTSRNLATKTSPERESCGPHQPAGAIPGQPQEHQERQVSRHPSTIPPAVASSIPPPLGTGRTTNNLFGGSGTPLRRGKWTKAEEEFAAATIQYFCGGLLNLQFGTLLRGFLAQQLHCHPMRISKKLLPGTTFCGIEISRKLGRRAYSPRWCDSPAATQQKLDAEDHLAVLRLKFVASVDEEAVDLVDEGAVKAGRDTRLSDGSTDRHSRASTASVADSPHSEARSEDASPVAQPQQQVCPEVAGLKRPREDGQWAAAEQRHYPQQQVYQPSHQQLQQQQQPYYSQQSYVATATSERRETELRPHAAPQNWYPSPPTAAAGVYGLNQTHVFYETVRRAVTLPRLSYNPQPSYAEPKPRVNSNSPPQLPVRPLLPSLRASLERASSYQQHR